MGHVLFFDEAGPWEREMIRSFVSVDPKAVIEFDKAVVEFDAVNSRLWDIYGRVWEKFYKPKSRRTRKPEPQT